MTEPSPSGPLQSRPGSVGVPDCGAFGTAGFIGTHRGTSAGFKFLPQGTDTVTSSASCNYL